MKNIKIVGVISLLLALVFLMACGAVEEYTLVVNYDTDGGNVIIEVDGQAVTDDVFDEGTQVTLRAEPALDWTFEGWQGDVTSVEEEVTITMDDNKTVTAVFAEILNDDASLSSLSVSAGTLNPAFDSDIEDYTVVLPYGTDEVSEVSATATDPNANVEITQATEVDGEATVVVTAEDGETEKTYTINFSIADSNDATLNSLSVSVGSLNPAFNSDIEDYTVVLPFGTEEVSEVSATATDPNATVEINDATEVDGEATVVVTAVDGETEKTYIIDFTIGPNTDASLNDLQVDGNTIEGFDSEIESYDVEFFGTTVPVVTATATDSNAEVNIIPTTELPGSTLVVVTAADEVTEKTYTVNFVEGDLDGLDFIDEVDEMGNNLIDAYGEIVGQLEIVSDSLIEDVEPYVQSFGLKISYSTLLLTYWYDTIDAPGDYEWDGNELVKSATNPLDPAEEDAWTWNFTLNDYLYDNIANSIEIALDNKEIVDYTDDDNVSIVADSTAEFSFSQTITKDDVSFEMNLTIEIEDFDDIYNDLENVDLSDFVLSIAGTINDQLSVNINGIECQPLGDDIPITGTIITDGDKITIDDFNYGDEDTLIQLALADFILELNNSLPTEPSEGISFDYNSITLNDGNITIGDIVITIDEYMSTSFTLEDERLLPEQIVFKGNYQNTSTGFNVSGDIEANFDYSNEDFIAGDISLSQGTIEGSEVMNDIEYAKLYSHKNSEGNVEYNNYYGTFKYIDGITVEIRFNNDSSEAADGIPGNSINFKAVCKNLIYTLDFTVVTEGDPGTAPLGYLTKDGEGELAQVRYESQELKVYFVDQPQAVVSLWTLAALRGVGLID